MRVLIIGFCFIDNLIVIIQTRWFLVKTRPDLLNALINNSTSTPNIPLNTPHPSTLSLILWNPPFLSILKKIQILQLLSIHPSALKAHSIKKTKIMSEEEPKLRHWLKFSQKKYACRNKSTCNTTPLQDRVKILKLMFLKKRGMSVKIIASLNVIIGA